MSNFRLLVHPLLIDFCEGVVLDVLLVVTRVPRLKTFTSNLDKSVRNLSDFLL